MTSDRAGFGRRLQRLFRISGTKVPVGKGDRLHLEFDGRVLRWDAAIAIPAGSDIQVELMGLAKARVTVFAASTFLVDVQ